MGFDVSSSRIEVVKMLSHLEPDFRSLNSETQRKVISQFQRIIGAEKTFPRRIGGVYDPVLNKFDVVKVSMIGLGRVMNDHHYAVVWDAPEKSETIVILPITSEVEPGRERFSIGSIEGLREPDHSIDANQPQTITRRSITEYPTKADPNGGTHPLPVRLNQTQQRKVLDLFHGSILKEKNLITALSNNISSKIPITITDRDRDATYRPIVYSVHQNFFFYKLPEEEQMRTIMVDDMMMPISEKKHLVRMLLVGDATERAAAEKTIAEKIAQRALAEAAIGRSKPSS